MSDNSSKEIGDDIYIRLAEHLDKLPIGFPRTESGVEIRLLKRLFTPEEALVATRLSIIPQTAKDIYRPFKKMGWSLDKLENILRKMWEKGLINGGERDGKFYYANAVLAVGIFEYQVGRLTPEFVKDFEKYIEEAFMDEIIKSPIPQLRPIPQPGTVRTIEMDTTVEHENIVTAYDELDRLLESASDYVSVAPCVCRESKDLLGEGCNHPKETCLQFGGAAHAYVDRGIGRRITKEDARKILEMAVEEGLVIQPSTTMRPSFICCCCGCSCEVLTNAKKLEKPALFFKSNYRAKVIPENCTGCGVCETYCPMEAAKVGDGGISVINYDRCIGCGVCVNKCPSEALVLERKPGEPFVPPKNMMDLYMQLARIKSKIRNRDKAGRSR